MKNPILDNRLVVDKTFACRLVKFISNIEVNDAIGHDEKESLIYYAEKLLRYQCLTAVNGSEKEYLNDVGVYDKYTRPMLVTYDGKDIFEGDDVILYSCLKHVKVTEQILHYNSRKLEGRSDKISDGRLYFYDIQKCLDYIDYNKPRYSKKDLETFLNEV